MTSNIYLASGFLDDMAVMKVGKANGIEQRQRQIRIAIELFHECVDETQAFYIERRMRWFMLNSGAIRIEGTIDWFKHDSEIYQKARVFLEDMLGVAVIQEYTKHASVEDAEIAAFQKRYRKMTGKKESIKPKTPHQKILEHRKEALNRFRELTPELKRNAYIVDAYFRLLAINTSKDNSIMHTTAQLNVYIDLISKGLTITGDDYTEFAEVTAPVTSEAG